MGFAPRRCLQIAHRIVLAWLPEESKNGSGDDIPVLVSLFREIGMTGCMIRVNRHSAREVPN
jgi:hypothetical protein